MVDYIVKMCGRHDYAFGIKEEIIIQTSFILPISGQYTNTCCKILDMSLFNNIGEQ